MFSAPIVTVWYWGWIRPDLFKLYDHPCLTFLSQRLKALHQGALGWDHVRPTCKTTIAHWLDHTPTTSIIMIAPTVVYTLEPWLKSILGIGQSHKRPLNHAGHTILLVVFQNRYYPIIKTTYSLSPTYVVLILEVYSTLKKKYCCKYNIEQPSACMSHLECCAQLEINVATICLTTDFYHFACSDWVFLSAQYSIIKFCDVFVFRYLLTASK